MLSPRLARPNRGRLPDGPATSVITLAASLRHVEGTPPPASFHAETQEVAPDVQEVCGVVGLEELEGSWDAIPTPWASPMQSYDWVRAWAEVYGADRDMEILVAGGRIPTGIAPMVRSPYDGVRLELVGPHELGEVMDFLYSDPSPLIPLSTALADSGLPLRLWRIPAESPVISALKKAYRHRGIVTVRPTAGVPSLPLDPSWVSPESHLDRGRRSNLRRAMRIAERIGPVTVEILTPKPAEVGPLIEEAFAVEVASWKVHSGTPLVRDPRLGEFFRRYAAAASEKGALRICFLRIGGRTAAMKLAAVAGNRLWLLAMGYADEFERCSPGTLLLIETIRHAAQSGLLSFEFLGADEPWIRPWTQIVRPCVLVRTYPLSVPGAKAVVTDTAAFLRAHLHGAREVASRVPRAIERRTARMYVAGPRLDDALRKCRELAAVGLRTTIGYVNADDDSPRAIMQQYRTAIEAIRSEGFDSYVSVKGPLLRFSRALFLELAQSARASNIGIHFDTLAAEDVDETFSLIREVQGIHSRIGCTLPGRWERSLADADRAVEMGLNVRVVKGEWIDRTHKENHPGKGFLEIVDRLAGRARHVAVATHNRGLAREALQRLRSAGTSCELEVLMGYPLSRVFPVAQAAGVPVRMYVPYGTPAPPYSLSEVKRNPRVAGWVLRDLCSVAKSRILQSPLPIER